MLRYIILLIVFSFVSTEIYFFHLISNLIGIFFTLIATVASGLLGLALAKREGLSAISGMRNISNLRKPYLTEMFNSFSIMLAALLLILPGFLTDFLGLLLIIAPMRQGITGFTSKMITRGFADEIRDRKFTNDKTSDGPIIDGEFKTVSTSADERPKSNTDSR